MGEAISQIWIDGLEEIMLLTQQQSWRILIFAKTVKWRGT